jgi:hypothetical protein
MSEKLMFREEELVLTAAALPVLSCGLRSRVLAAAAAARARRSQGRRVVAGTAVVFALMGWLAWTGPFLPSAGQLAGTDFAARDRLWGGRTASTGAAPLSSCSRRERFIAALADDCRMVEAEFESREDVTWRVQM